jgi:hypothetical protein
MTTLYHGGEHSRSGVSNHQWSPLVCAIPASLWRTLTACIVIKINPCQLPKWGAFRRPRNHLQAANANEHQTINVRSYNDAVRRTLTVCRRMIINGCQLKVRSTVSRKTFTFYTATKIDRYQFRGYLASWWVDTYRLLWQCHAINISRECDYSTEEHLQAIQQTSTGTISATIWRRVVQGTYPLLDGR